MEGETVIRKKFTAAGVKIRGIVEQGRLVDTDNSNLFLFRGMYKGLQGQYDTFQKHYDELLELYAANGKESEFPSSQDKNLQMAVDRYFYEAHAIYEKHVNTTLPSNINATQHGASFLNETRLVRARLPQVNLPTFNGNQTDWQIFHDTYKSLIHDECSISNIEKFHFLMSCLKGPSLSLIKGVKFVESNYDQAWKLLTDTYNDKRRLAGTYLNSVLNMTPFRNKPSALNLKNFQTTVIENIASFKHLDIPENDDFILCYLALRCLDPQTRRDFEVRYADVEFPTFENLRGFIKSELRSLELTYDVGRNEAKGPVGNVMAGAKGHSFPDYRRTLFSDNENERENSFRSRKEEFNQRRDSCPVCKSLHTLYQCKRFKTASAQEKINYLRCWSGCNNCFSSKHNTRGCPSSRSCQTCKLRHHSWLHVSPSTSVNPSNLGTVPDMNPSTSIQTGVTLSGTSSCGEVILGTALVRVKDAMDRFQTVRIVTDCGSQNSFITAACVERLGLVPDNHDLTISGIGQVRVAGTKGRVNCTLRSRFGGGEFRAEPVVVNEITGHLPHSLLPRDFHTRLGAYELADPTYWKPQPIDFLLGADLYFEIITGGPFQVSPGYPKLVPSILGHIVAGKCHHVHHQQDYTSLLCNQNQYVGEIISKFWESENVPADPPESDEDKTCERLFTATHYRLPSGRFVVSLPFRSTIDTLQSPTVQVKNRLKRLEYRLQHNPPLLNEYVNFMNEYISLGHMTLTSSIGKYLIPHHCVFKREDTAKLRVVFDGSCKGPHGSLNCHLIVGPKLQRDISDIILNFRIHRIALVADIVKMYRQILIRPEDRIYQHILWRADPVGPVQEYELNTVTYGLASAPYLAMRALQQLAKTDGVRYPQAAQVILNDVYVDDIVSGADTLHEVLELKSQLISLLRQGGFELSKWRSNIPRAINDVNDSSCDTPLTLNPEDDQGSYKILGLQYLPFLDCFTFSIISTLSSCTKRGILSTIARIYDPLGFLAPVVFLAKIILKEVWLANCDWDDLVPSHIGNQWHSFTQQLSTLSDIKISRHLITLKSSTSYLIGFCDASERGYAATLYLHLRSDETTKTFLLKAKTKLAPKKLMTIPRLELCGALLLTRLVTSCQRFIEKIKPNQKLFFTDSTTVLGWLRTSSNRHKAFVAHRVVEILEATEISSWHHVSSEDNPADCSSRGIMPHQLASHPLWWSGPPWLADSPQMWPLHHVFLETEELPELKPVQQIVLHSTSFPDILHWISRFSCYSKLINSMCFVLRFVLLTKTRIKRLGIFNLAEINEARITCIRLVQEHHFNENKNIFVSKLWKSLNPFRDARGIFRVGGRLSQSSLPFESKHPAILPSSHFSQLLVNYYHVIHLHVGPSTLQSLLRQRYYLLSARKIVRSCVRRCRTCQIISAKPRPPFMGELPSCRLQEGQVFQHVGVDLGGPFLLKESNRRKNALGKAYLCLFVCMVTKALHLEVVTSCSTEAFLAALHRFTSRRGRPQHIYSDCGTNFVGAASKLKEHQLLLRNSDFQDDVHQFATEQEITWHFNPPHTPHFGGLWEAGIKSAKTLLARNLRNTPLTFEEMSTLFCRIEAVLNSRPLCPIESSTEAMDCLTPGHFLIGRPIISAPEDSLMDAKEHTLNRWQLIQQRVQHFWKQWRASYLNQLQQRRKWISHHPNLKEGDLVILKDSNCPPTTWPLGRVSATHPGLDGIVRVATIRTSKGEYQRPVAKLVPLLFPEHYSSS